MEKINITHDETPFGVKIDLEHPTLKNILNKCKEYGNLDGITKLKKIIQLCMEILPGNVYKFKYYESDCRNPAIDNIIGIPMEEFYEIWNSTLPEAIDRRKGDGRHKTILFFLCSMSAKLSDKQWMDVKNNVYYNTFVDVSDKGMISMYGISLDILTFLIEKDKDFFSNKNWLNILKKKSPFRVHST
ncbi:MAG: hypothetical protein Satyrvirus27_1 [Satyrvirus sp.]|uniref:Uncharacterized protein n=1 Tax=Satyrvirus sp. TaxID=2487771 RepID=A0A3G5AG99_9VIRU|nr:MAG: hypothetical protein Satyrvirus27_1 [Satyrvirus sp.]